MAECLAEAKQQEAATRMWAEKADHEASQQLHAASAEIKVKL